MEALRLWYRNSGFVTHEAIQKVGAKRREDLFEYLRGLPLSYDIEVDGNRYKLVHAFPVELYGEYHYEYSNERTFAVWHRYRKDEFIPDDYILIFGHTPTVAYQLDNPLRIYHGNHVIGMDCGSGYDQVMTGWQGWRGNLACLCLDTGREFYSEEDLEDD